MRIEEFLSLLDSAKFNSGQYICRCPGPLHSNGDRHPSLAVREGERGILVHCFGGCTVVDICDALGITQADLFFDRNRGPRPLAFNYKDLLCILAREALVIQIAGEDLAMNHPLSDSDLERVREAVKRISKLIGVARVAQ